QRDRGPVRARRCRRAGGCARHRARQPDRRQIPTRRSGLWRLVLSQGHAGAYQDRAGLRGAASHRRNVASVNEIRKRAMARKVVAALGASLRGKTVGVLGLTFKPNTDDMRDAPSIPLITALHDLGAKVRAYDPIGMEQAKKVLPELTYCEDEYECAKGADALVIVTEWEQFRALDLDRLKEVMAEKPAIVDLRNIYLPEEMRQRGFVYESVGRPKDN